MIVGKLKFCVDVWIPVQKARDIWRILPNFSAYEVSQIFYWYTLLTYALMRNQNR